jgi:two-component system LytT family response regulator
MITCLIIDDEKNSREVLNKIINQYFSSKLYVVDAVDSVAKGVEVINKLHPELVFLDIEMKGEDGFQLFKHFDSVFFDIIFTTAHKNYAIEAIKHAAIDYLLKPLNFVDLNDAIKRLERKQTAATNQLRINALLQNLNTDSTKFNKIALPTATGYTLEKISNILYCRGDGNYSKITTLQNKEIVVSKTLKYLEGILPSAVFSRIHKSTLVNLNYVNSYSRENGHSITMTTGKKFDVSFRKNDEFLSSILQNKAQPENDN